LQLWCESPETNSTISKAKSDVHSTGRLRVIGTVSNSQDFAKAYNCSIGSAMNPERKCHIWKWNWLLQILQIKLANAW